ncbi:unnamed protein product [Prorocentrum cordatum]|uniref:Uncharacterized protein n=1 Tax=Prorocentrum cordatum TaxID=2364126 RepID=A0ABN9PRD7_9DINO|nr:unnamed protein product [Polarella glacialis]
MGSLSLKLGSPSVTASGVESLADALGGLRGLCSLRLSLQRCRTIGCRGAGALAARLGELPRLAELELDATQGGVGAAGRGSLDALADGLRARGVLARCCHGGSGSSSSRRR